MRRRWLCLGAFAVISSGACGGTSRQPGDAGSSGVGASSGSSAAGGTMTGSSGLGGSGASAASAGAADARECTASDVRDCGSSTGACKLGVQTCSLAGVWTACSNEVRPTPEVCDGIDNDCNGKVDDGLSAQCPLGCEAGVCRQCAAGEAKCLSANSAGVCLATTASWSETPCPLGCNDASGKCNECTPGSVQCLYQQGVAHSTTQQTCRADGSGFDNLACQPLGCSDTTGQCQICYPGDHRCVDMDTEQVCMPDGTKWGPQARCEQAFGCTEHSGCNACQPFSCLCTDPVIPSQGAAPVMSSTSQCGADGQLTGTYNCQGNGQGNCVDTKCELNQYNACQPQTP